METFFLKSSPPLGLIYFCVSNEDQNNRNTKNIFIVFKYTVHYMLLICSHFNDKNYHRTTAARERKL